MSVSAWNKLFFTQRRLVEKRAAASRTLSAADPMTHPRLYRPNRCSRSFASSSATTAR